MCWSLNKTRYLLLSLHLFHHPAFPGKELLMLLHFLCTPLVAKPVTAASTQQSDSWRIWKHLSKIHTWIVEMKMSPALGALSSLCHLEQNPAQWKSEVSGCLCPGLPWELFTECWKLETLLLLFLPSFREAKKQFCNFCNKASDVVWLHRVPAPR